ncbi:MAG: ECF transporter S component [Candidatus Nanopelagicaceae bacterium]|nr:ECF transporter S component [Candidatus Nanopelagicaceae bacterium]
MRRNSFLLLAMGSLVGLISFTWPLYLPDTQFWLFQPEHARLLALLIASFAVGLIAIEISRGAMDAKAVAILGVLSALIAALRLVGAGAVGVEPMWFLLILASYAFGPTFGFSLGVVSLGVSAILTGGVGPWLPFQMLAAGWIGMLAGAFSKMSDRNMKLRSEILLLLLIGITSSLIFGLLMDLQLWPWLTGTDTQLSFIAGASIIENLQRFMVFHLATALAWDLPRAVTTGVLLWITAGPVLNSFRRARLRLNLTSREIQPAEHV